MSKLLVLWILRTNYGKTSLSYFLDKPKTRPIFSWRLNVYNPTQKDRYFLNYWNYFLSKTITEGELTYEYKLHFVRHVLIKKKSKRYLESILGRWKYIYWWDMCQDNAGENRWLYFSLFRFIAPNEMLFWRRWPGEIASILCSLSRNSLLVLHVIISHQVP